MMSLMLLCLAGACTDDFETLNTNPNKPTEVSAQYLLPQALQASVDNYWGNKTRNQRISFDHAMSWAGYLTRNIYENEGDNYNVQPSVTITGWEVFYTDGLVNFQKIIDISGEGADRPNANYEGIGMGMRAWVFSLMTDIWGAIPYSEALKGNAEEATFSPAYDTQEAIYAGMIENLKIANQKLDPTGPAINGDILFQGDIMLWKKFFNSLRFRLLNRQAHKVASSATDMQAMLDEPATYPMMESNTDIAQLNYGSLPTNNPWNDILVRQGRTDWNANSVIVEKLQSLNDPRLEVYFTPGSLAEGMYSGHASGFPGEIATTFLGYSAVINQDVFAQSGSPGVLMSYAELMFLKAEAALEGNITGDANAFFEAGITAAFNQYQLPLPDGYVASLGGVTKENIITQKWIALFGQGIEAWTELRRTGYPTLPAADPRAQFRNDGVLPTRMTYPSTEYSLNRANTEAGVALNGGADDMKTALWWVE